MKKSILLEKLHIALWRWIAITGKHKRFWPGWKNKKVWAIFTRYRASNNHCFLCEKYVDCNECPLYNQFSCGLYSNWHVAHLLGKKGRKKKKYRDFAMYYALEIATIFFKK